MDVVQEILRLKKERDAVILVHNYQRPEIHAIADHLGDSLNLARAAAGVDSRTIVFCGVSFMAETAKILAPDRTVLLPRTEARCPMAEMVGVDALREARAAHSDAQVVCYVNTTAEVKALSDACCTSANAVKVVQAIPAERVIFVPDRNLAAWCQRFTDKEIIPWDGFCYVHARITADEVRRARRAAPDALLMVHPECCPEVLDLADEVLSTEGMVRLARQSDRREFLVGTEEGLIARLARENPGKTFYAAGTSKTCTQMKLTTLEDVYLALDENRHEVALPAETLRKARRALDRMLELA